jgi:Tfp pilus assembly pilus retraction ATPase PilT
MKINGKGIEMIKIDLDKMLEKIIDKCSENKFTEITLEQDKNIIFMRFMNNLLETEEFSLPNLKIDYNLVEKYTQNLVGIDNKDKDNYVKTFLTPVNKILCRVYIYKNQHGRMINIKILDHSVEDFKNYISKIPNATAEEKGIYYNEILKNKNSIIIISAQTENLKRNFAYSIIEEINKNKVSKIISFEDPIEQLIVNKKSFVHQMTYFKDAINYVRFLTPDYVFIHENLDKEILLSS